MTLLHRLNHPNRHAEEFEVGPDHAQVHLFAIGRNVRDRVGAQHGRPHAEIADAPFARLSGRCYLLRRLLLHGDMIRRSSLLRDLLEYPLLRHFAVAEHAQSCADEGAPLNSDWRMYMASGIPFAAVRSCLYSFSVTYTANCLRFAVFLAAFLVVMIHASIVRVFELFPIVQSYTKYFKIVLDYAE